MRRANEDLAGEITVRDGEGLWKFTPRDPWGAGEYQLRVASDLEYPAGNRPGRAFEVTQPVSADRSPTELRFRVGS